MSGPDMAGSIEKRGKMFQYYDVMSDDDEEEEEEADDMASDEDEALERDTEASIVGDSAPADITGNSLSPKSSNPTPRIRDAEYWADLNAMDELRELTKTARNFLPFAHWAFGDDGIPSLQVLAYGDFSFEDRFKWKNHILCRQTWTVPNLKKDNTVGDDEDNIVLPFRPIRDSDIKMMELVNENMDFLGACPVDPIVMSSEY